MRTRKEIEDESSKAVLDFPSVVDSVRLNLILEVLLDIRDILVWQSLPKKKSK